MEWRKSSYSANNGACVEVAVLRADRWVMRSRIPWIKHTVTCEVMREPWPHEVWDCSGRLCQWRMRRNCKSCRHISAAQ
jgi:Domain of unknown function (DUF397)